MKGSIKKADMILITIVTIVAVMMSRYNEENSSERLKENNANFKHQTIGNG